MKRKSFIYFGETTILSLSNLTTGTKFQVVAQIKDIDLPRITITDDYDDLEISIEGEKLSGLEVGETVIFFGEKIESGVKKERILTLNCDWNLYQKTRELESR